MKYPDLSSRSRLRSTWLKFASASLLAVALAGCGGGDDGAVGPAGPAGPPGADGPAGTPAVPTVQVAALTPAQWADANFTGVVTGVTIASPPVVSFKVTDAAGNPVAGLGSTSKNATAKFASYPNFAFALAKLVPGANGSPSKWINYAVTTVETTTAAVTATRPSTDNTGTLVDNGDGSYKYTFYRDITKSKDVVAGLTLTSPNVAADLGDLTYDASLTHRLVIQLYGNAPGTGSNTANGVTLTPAVAMKNPINIVYDFIPATGQVVTAASSQREITSTAKCNECHDKIGVTTPHGGRVDTRYCVTCHTDQRKFGRAEATTTATGFSGFTYTIGGMAVGNFPVFVHKIHMGNKLTKDGYNYANVLFNPVALPQDVTNCTKCHDGSATSTAKTAQGDNWKNVPTILACGSCHDGINFATGGGTTVKGALTGHIGGAKANDAQCVLCHDATTIPIYHAGVNQTPHNLTVPAGLANFTYEISSAAVNATNDLAIKFRILKDGTAITLADPAAVVATPLTGFTGGPSFMLAYTGQAGSADFDNLGKSAAQPATVTIATLLDTDNAAIGSISARDPADGSYTATIKSASAFPAGSKLRTVAMQAYFTQAAGTGGIAAATARHTLSVVKTVTGDTKRRVIVDPGKCANCHEVFEGHGGNRNIGKLTGTSEVIICVMCHNPNLSSSGTTVNLAYEEATQNLKDMIHGIHAGKFRKDQGGAAFVHYRAKSGAASKYDWSEVVFPGILNNCETCHKAGTYASVPAGALVTTDMTIGATNATTADVIAARASLPNATDKVISPFTGACVSCHNSTVAKSHMAANGGLLNVVRSTANTETCAVCHGAGRVSDVVVKHK